MLKNVEVILGNIDEAISADAFPAFDDRVIDLLGTVADRILKTNEYKSYKDLISIAFFFRKGALRKIKQTYEGQNRMGVGFAFHITPSNVPVQFFYSLGISLLAGNSNIVRMPSKVYEQTSILIHIIEETLNQYEDLRDRICLIKYGHEQEITEYFSEKCDVRIIWGGDEAIRQVRQAPLSARAYDVTFADRFSISLINAEKFMECNEKEAMVSKFYLDTYYSDQNACNSTRMVVWKGKKEVICKSKELFWSLLAELVEKEYGLLEISAVEKLIKGFSLAIDTYSVYNKNNSYKNYVNVVDIESIPGNLSQYKGNCGFFLQYEIEDWDQLIPYVKKEWQTMTYFGENPKEILFELEKSGIKGIDRIVPVGMSGEPSLFWDGMNLIERMSRTIQVL